MRIYVMTMYDWEERPINFWIFSEYQTAIERFDNIASVQSKHGHKVELWAEESGENGQFHCVDILGCKNL